MTENLLSSLNFCVIDLETTGGHHKRDKIIEIGLAKISNLEIKETMNLLVNPEIPIPDFIQNLTSIGPSDVADQPTIDGWKNSLFSLTSPLVPREKITGTFG